MDAEAREQGLTGEARHRPRQQKAPELLQKIKADIEAAKPGALPGGALEGACEYALEIWQRLTCFLQYPELERFWEVGRLYGSWPLTALESAKPTSGPKATYP